MADTSSARERWRHDLGSWAIPEDILAQAEVSPWRITPDLFEVDDDYHETVSDEHARDVVREGSRVLDVGCGAGVAAMALASARPIVVGLDRDPAMLERFEHNARNRGLRVETIEGLWPDVADRAPRADVVLAHHVVYNVADIEPFIRALDAQHGSCSSCRCRTRCRDSTTRGATSGVWSVRRARAPTT